MSMRVFVLTIPQTHGEQQHIASAHPVIGGELRDPDSGERRRFCFGDVQFADGSTGIGVSWPNADPMLRDTETLAEIDLVKAWVHGAQTSQPDAKSFWLDVIEDLVNNVLELSPSSGSVGQEIGEAMWNTLQQRLGLCLLDTDQHEPPPPLTNPTT